MLQSMGFTDHRFIPTIADRSIITAKKPVWVIREGYLVDENDFCVPAFGSKMLRYLQNNLQISSTLFFCDTVIPYHNLGLSWVLDRNTVFDKSDFYKIVSIYL
jgi:hypothetical protein